MKCVMRTLLHMSGDEEEARLLAIVTDCIDRVNACAQALWHPGRILLMPEYRKLVDDLEMARAEREKATAALREYRKSRHAPST
jgi:hypothetical protein